MAMFGHNWIEDDEIGPLSHWLDDSSDENIRPFHHWLDNDHIAFKRSLNDDLNIKRRKNGGKRKNKSLSI